MSRPGHDPAALPPAGDGPAGPPSAGRRAPSADAPVPPVDAVDAVVAAGPPVAAPGPVHVGPRVQGVARHRPDAPDVLELVGDVDHAAVVDAEPLVARLAGTVRTVDVAGVDFLDSAGVHLLLRLRAAAPDEHLVLRGARPDGLVLSVLALLGLAEAFGRA